MADQDQERLKGGMGQQDVAKNQSAGQSSDEGSGVQSGGAQGVGSGAAGQDPLSGNDQVGGGLGQNQQSYGQSTEHDTTGGLGKGQANLGAQGQSGHLGPGPSSSQGSASPATGGPDLSKGLSDQNRGGGGV